ncbi:hypothetical protein Tco_1289746 [Tanacetum coccineum]
MVFHKMGTKEISDRFVAPCFVNGLEAYDGEINLGVEENMISNEFAVKLCLEHEIGIQSHGYKEQVMSSPTHPTLSDVKEECTFSSTNILDYTSTLPDYFPASPGNIFPDFLENSKNDENSPVFSSFYNNPYLKDTQAFYAKKSPILPPDPISPPAILTPSLVLPPLLLFDP